MQNIVTNLGEGSSKGLTEGLKEIIKIDNERALEVGYLDRVHGKFQYAKAESSRRMPRGDGQGKFG